MTEREAIVAWLRAEITKPHKWMDRPTWVAVLWAMLCPRAFGEFYGRIKIACEAIDAIEAGQHLENNSIEEPVTC